MKLPDGPFTNALAAFAVALYVILAITGYSDAAFVAAGVIPARLSGWAIGGGSMVPALLTPITAFFLHVSVMHLLFNMLMLLFLGRQLELPLRPLGLALLLLAGVYGGALVTVLADARSVVPNIGASAGTSALLAAYALVLGRSTPRAVGPIPGRWVQALWLAAAWIGLQLLIGLATGFTGIGVWAHVGGFIAGLLVIRPLLRMRFRS